MSTERLSLRGWSAVLLAVLLGVVLLPGCSHKKDTKKTNDKPMALVPVTNHFEVRRVWSNRISGESPKLRLGLGVAASGERVFVASHKGVVDAFALDSGKRLWRVRLKAPLSGGPSAGHDRVAVGTSKGEVILLSETDGSVLWRVRVNSEILAGPAIGADLVVVRTVDGKMHGLAVKDGVESWVVDQQVPKLSLRGTSAPTLSGDLAITGFDNGRVVAVNRRNGSTVWDAAVGQSHGSTELARLIDVDSPVVVEGEDLFTVAFQGRVVHISRDTGQVLWTHDVSSYRGLAIDADSVYVSTADGDIVRLDRKNGTEQWRQKAMERRQLTAPVLYEGYPVVADGGGVLHWLNPANGDVVARAEVDKSSSRNALKSKGISLKRRISSEPIAAGGLLLVFTDSGLLSAFRSPPPGGK
ncbi:MAG TPA: outer membrane protein assembly factor BamB [Steroidobacteraceae bacterium]|nr:outer membrane protein assembly factor BamB [Steroidobacteraceae bacterium]